MICMKCQRHLVRCICVGDESAENRIAKLRQSPYLAMDWDGMLAQRLLNRFDIERDRENQNKEDQK